MEHIKINESIAELFYTQCMGEYPGHMSNIPHNPTLRSICEASGVNTHSKKDFAEFLIQVAETLASPMEKDSK